MRGWLLDTNVVAALVNPRGAPSVKAWAAAQDETDMHISVLTLAEFDKGIHKLTDDHPDRPRYLVARDALADRFGNRVLSVEDEAVRTWGRLSGDVMRRTGQAPPVVDTLLCASAIVAELYLVTRNVRDTRPTGALVFDPWNDDPAAFPLGQRTRRR